MQHFRKKSQQLDKWTNLAYAKIHGFREFYEFMVSDKP